MVQYDCKIMIKCKEWGITYMGYGCNAYSIGLVKHVLNNYNRTSGYSAFVCDQIDCFITNKHKIENQK